MAASTSGPTITDMVSDYFTGVTLKAMLVGAGYTFDKHTHDFRADVTSEVTGTGYTAGGITLTGVAVAQDTANSRAEISAANADFGTLTVTGITQIVVYISTGSAATDRIVSVHTHAAQSPSGVNYTYAWNDDDANAGTNGVIGYVSY